jgi:hypothetical protein
MTDPWDKTPDEQTFARDGAEITTSDSDDLAIVSKGLVLLSAGTVRFLPVDGDSAIAYTDDLPVGYIVPYFVRKVYATGTSATVASLTK